MPPFGFLRCSGRPQAMLEARSSYSGTRRKRGGFQTSSLWHGPWVLNLSITPYEHSVGSDGFPFTLAVASRAPCAAPDGTLRSDHARRPELVPARSSAASQRVLQ